jgi:hypothetical protein
MANASKIQGEKRGGAANLTNAGKGRPKGAINKNTQALKDMILGALDNKGGVAYLEKQADENPTAFLSLIGKVLPTTLQGTGEGGKHITELVVRVERG